MREAQLSILLVSVLQTGMAVRGFAGIGVKKYNQPRQQGVPTAATVFFQHVFTRNVGWVERQDVYNPVTTAMDHIETQRRESRYQIGALAPQTPSDPTLPTAADYVLTAASVMQSSAALATFIAAQVGVQWVSEISILYFEDDKGQNEENPHFDIILSHQDVFTVPGIAITNFEERIKSV